DLRERGAHVGGPVGDVAERAPRGWPLAERGEHAAPHPERHRGGEGERVEVAVVARAQPLDERGGAREVDEVARELHRPVVQRGHHLGGHALEPLLPRQVGVGERHERADEGVDRLATGAGDDEAQREEAVHHAVRVPADGGVHGVHEPPPGLERHAHHHPEVEQHEPAVGGDEQVARVRVGVEQPVDEHHLHVHLHHLPHDARGGHAPLARPLLQRVDAPPLDELHHEHAAPRHRRLDARHHEPRVAGEVRADLLRVRRLGLVVHLVGDALGELVDHRADAAHVHAERPGDARLHDAEDAARRDEVLPHELLHARAQHLHRDVAPPVARAVHLAQRRRRDRLGVEPLEQRGRGLAVALADHPLHRRQRHRGHAVGEGAERGEVGLGDDVGARGEHLRELHEGGTEPRDHAHEALGAARVERRRARRRPAGDEPPPVVAPEREDEGEEPEGDDDGAHERRCGWGDG
ncbi:MAG: hypothetical protein AVDCRST_MAG11-1804, partial [uncultured Gemmatimonadaceae bacterium]